MINYEDRIDKIKEIMQKQGLTQKQFAEAIGCTQQNISRLLNGKGHITENFLKRVHETFPQYSMIELMCFKDGSVLSAGICNNKDCNWYTNRYKNGCAMLNNISGCKERR